MDYYDGIIKNTEFFTTSELAEKLKMNVQVITRKIQAGEIGAYKIGKDWRIPEQSVHEWLENHSNRNGKSGRKKTADTGGRRKTTVLSGRAEATDQQPTRRSKRRYLLEYILAQFEPNREYTEAEVNRIIARYHSDSKTVRQEFLAEKMMSVDGDVYRRRAGYVL